MSGMSSRCGKSTILKWINNLNDINSTLDIGAGSGTYYHLLKSVIGGKWEGIEIYEPNIKKYNLENYYDKIYSVDAREFDWTNKSYDLVITGDVLEHMTKEESIKLINNVLEHSNACIISIPIVWYPQDSVDGNDYEIHVKDDWSHEEVLSSFSHIKLAKVDDNIGVYLLSKTLEIEYSDESEKHILERNKNVNKRVNDIKNLYLTILERKADYGGLKHYVDGNLNIPQIEKILLSSNEYKQLLNIKFIQNISVKDFANEPVVSIIIPVFRNVFWMIDSINSLLNQTYKQFEIIIVNDGSKEDVDAIIKLYSNFPNIKYYKHDVNKGVSAARNTGISYATGKYILPVDSDDVASDTNWLNDCIKLIDENTIVTTPYNLCDRNMHPLNEIWPPRQFEFSEIINRGGGGIIVNSSMYPKTLWTKINGYDENLIVFEDADFWLRAYFEGYKLKHLQKPYVNYRKHGNGLSDSNIKIKESAWNYRRKKHNIDKTYAQILAIELLDKSMTNKN